MAPTLPQLTRTQQASQAARLAQVRPALAAAYAVALERWLGDRKLLVLGRPIVTQGYRSPAAQDALFAQGRAGLLEVNRLRGLAGMERLPAGAAEAGRVVTYKRGGQSHHNRWPSEALDVAHLQADGSVKWDNAALLLFSHLLLAADARIVWGADWNHNGRTDDEHFHDWPHFELTA